MPILIDFSQLAISCAVVFPDDMQKGKDTQKMQDIIRHVTLKSIVTTKQKFKKYGEVILCCDSSPSWRRKVFPYYKAHRAKNREESNIDWETIRKFIDELKFDLEENFPYKIISAPYAEGDDCIAVLTKHISTGDVFAESDNPLDAFSGEPPPILISSSDHDFKQLHKFKNVKQWSMMQKKMVDKAENDFIIDKIIGGDGGDGIPSVLMPDDWLVNGEGRAKPVTAKVRERFRDLSSLTEEELARYNRNKLLIDFEMIPEYITKSVLDSYNATRKKTTRANIFDYLIKHR